MGKNRKKVTAQKKKSIYDRTCERCGNDFFSKKRIYTCPYCLWTNGLKRGAEYDI